VTSEAMTIESTFSGAAPAVLKIDGARRVPGYVHGLRAPSAMVRLTLSHGGFWLPHARRAAVMLGTRLSDTRLAASGDPSNDPRLSGDAGAIDADDVRFLALLLRILHAVSQEIGLPDVGETRAFPLRRPAEEAEGVRSWQLALPSYSPDATVAALSWIVQWLRKLSDAGEAQDASSTEWWDELNALIDKLNLLAPPGVNVRHFIRAAHELSIPWIVLPAGVIQYGWGKNARWLNATFTDVTPNISARFARDKAAGNALLRMAGVPVPEQRRVRDVEAAVKAAEALGYPVVVKPANLDGGHGVAAGLTSEAELRVAFERAAKLSRDVLVEKHVEGRDYRIIVFQGRAVWAVERVPAGVTGDGERSIRELIELTNRDPRRAARRWAQMKPLTVNEEAKELLDAADLTLDSVPAKGEFVRLRRAANVSSGGTPIVVFDRMHPDNARLAERAVRAMRLDLAGVDLLMPDISRSWMETGAAICEVNGQPQLSVTSPHIYAQIFKGLIAGQGRIPVALVLSAKSASELAKRMADVLAGNGLCVGVSTPEGLTVGGTLVRRGRQSAFADARTLLIDNSVEAIVLVTDGQEFLPRGLPFDRFDALVVADDWKPPAGDAQGTALVPVLRLLGSHLAGNGLVVRGHPQFGLIAQCLGASRVRAVPSRQHLPGALARLLTRTADSTAA